MSHMQKGEFMSLKDIITYEDMLKVCVIIDMYDEQLTVISKEYNIPIPNVVHDYSRLL